MYLVMGITGKVGGATARRLLKQGKQVRALVRNREKAAKWAELGVELVDGDWNDATAIAAALKGVEGAFVMLPAIWAPSPDYREAKGVIANYVEALTKVVPPRVVALSSMGANRTSGLPNASAVGSNSGNLFLTTTTVRINVDLRAIRVMADPDVQAT